MCGIWGVFPRYSSGLATGDLKEVKQMMLDTVQRGEHSTGLFMTEFRDPKAPPTGVKVKGGPHTILYGDVWKDIENFVQQSGGSIVGHGRWATRGQVNADNAHPFQYEHITLVHNGTIYGGLEYKKGSAEKVPEVDSHALAVAIAEKGFVEALTDIHGAYAIIAHNAHDGCIYFARNADRPLFLYTSDNRHYLMSEPIFLRALLINGNRWKDGTSVMQVKEEMLLKLDLAQPYNIQVVANLKTVREEKEAKKAQRREEERKKREEEARTRSVSSVTSTTAQDRGSHRKKPIDLIFEVVDIVPMNNGNYRYNCESIDGENVYFITDTNKPEYLDMVGQCKMHAFYQKNNEEWYFVKHREIEWAEMENVKKEEAPRDEGATFHSANGVSITAALWHVRVTEEGCDSCCKTFKPDEIDQVVIDEKRDVFLCKRCAEYQQVWLQTERTPTIH